MTGNEYQSLAMRTNDDNNTKRLEAVIEVSKKNPNIDAGGILNACLGLCGEAGETLDLVKHWIFHETPLNLDHLKKEIGDTMWYVALLCESFGFNMDEIMQINIDKLKNRYPDGFDVEKSRHRAKDDV